MSDDNKVLVLQATGKAGRNIALALKNAGFEVFGTTRSAKNNLASKGITPVIANYTVQADIERAIKESGAKKVIGITDFFKAAKSRSAVEIAHGQAQFEACKAGGVAHYIFVSVAQCNDTAWPTVCKHIHTKAEMEKNLKASGIPHSILRPCAFLENFDDAASYNPLKKGALKFLSKCVTPTGAYKWVSTYDVGRAAAAHFKDPAKYLGTTLECMSWQGSLDDVRAALQTVSGVPVKASLAMPICLRKLFLKDLDGMCNFFDGDGLKDHIAEFKAVVPDPLDAEGWFRFHNRYANGKKIVDT